MNVLKNKAGFEFIILKADGKNLTIQFLESGSVRVANSANVYSGKVKDYYAKTRYGIGCIGEYQKVSYHKQAMQLWGNMMKRCYSDFDIRGYKEKGTTVEARWLCFANFLEDIKSLEGFWYWKNNKGYELDKDLRIPGANVYSKETCSFVPAEVNRAAGKGNKTLIDGEWVTTTP